MIDEKGNWFQPLLSFSVVVDAFVVVMFEPVVSFIGIVVFVVVAFIGTIVFVVVAFIGTIVFEVVMLIPFMKNKNKMHN